MYVCMYVCAGNGHDPVLAIFFGTLDDSTDGCSSPVSIAAMLNSSDHLRRCSPGREAPKEPLFNFP